MLQISSSGMRPLNPGIMVGGTPRLMTEKISASLDAVIRLVIGEIGWLLASLLLDDGDRHAGSDRALCQVPVTGRAIGVVRPLSDGDRSGVDATGFRAIR